MKVLVTGSSTGFGKLIAETLKKEGHDVAGTMRNVAGKNQEAAKALEASGIKVVDLDVTDDSSVEKGVASAIEVLGGLDVVVNNAGIATAGLMETFTIEDFKKVFEVNVFGVQRVNRAALPYLRKQGSGLLIHISSLVGRMVLPFMGPYVASKWALEGLLESYRLETSNQGIESVSIEPGGFPTEIFSKLGSGSDTERNASFGDFAKAPEAFFNGFGETLQQKPEQKPQLVADAVAKLIATPAGERPLRTTVDKLGMGDGVDAINKAYDDTTAGLNEALGIADLTKLKQPA